MRHSLARPSGGVAVHHAKAKSTVVVARAAPPRGGGAASPSGLSTGGSSPSSRVEVLKKEKELLQETLAAAAQATDQLAGALQVSRVGDDGIERLSPGQGNGKRKNIALLPLPSEARARSILFRF